MRVLEIPDDMAAFELPPAVHTRLQFLLDRQDGGQALTNDERAEAEGLVAIAELLSLLKLRVTRAN